MSDVSAMRRTYLSSRLELHEVDPDPYTQTTRWLEDAIAHPELIEPNAMTLATVDADGRPSARIVLLRAFDKRGCVFYSNYESRKARDLAVNPMAALLFYWDRLERELRIEGRVERLDPDESDTYFATRPRGHRLGAWASPQSREIADRLSIEQDLARYEREYDRREVPRPPHWGGYRLMPTSFEFWQGRPNRLHDRICYERNECDRSQWRLFRRAP